MARYATSGTSQAGQATGAPVTTTVNGYMGYWGAASGTGFRLRRVQLGVTTSATGAPTSQQYAVGIFRQTVAPSGTGLAAAVLGQALESWTAADPTVGLIMTTATTIGTTGPTVAANPLYVIPLNSQSFVDTPYDMPYEDLVCGSGTANGFAFVLLGASPLPSGHSVRLGVEVEV